jgi:transmembrane sensor
LRGGPHDGEFATAVGERSTVTLADGSSVVLNTNTRIETAFDAGVRRIRLRGGQALFEVAPVPARPFVVEAGNRTITALGTAFDVRVDEGAVQVLVVDGSIAVQEKSTGAGELAGAVGPPDSRIEMKPGEHLLARTGLPDVVQHADVEQITSWREGRIVFDNDTLASAVAEVNRYSRIQIVLGDPDLAQLRVSGVFAAGGTQSFLETVTRHYSLRITGKSEDRIVLAPPG